MSEVVLKLDGEGVRLNTLEVDELGGLFVDFYKLISQQARANGTDVEDIHLTLSEVTGGSVGLGFGASEAVRKATNRVIEAVSHGEIDALAPAAQETLRNLHNRLTKQGRDLLLSGGLTAVKIGYG